MIFARVADEGSFSRAAERLGLPKATVSRRVAALESQLSERLLLRTTRKLTLTEFGASVLQHAHQLAAEVEATVLLAQHRQSRPTGRLRVSMPSDLVHLAGLEPVLIQFITDHEAVSVEAELSARRVDVIGENFDVALRVGELPDDASLAARKLAVFAMGLYASPAYVKTNGTPPTPDALMQHRALPLLLRSGRPERWHLGDGKARWEGAPPVRAATNSPELLIRLACAGAGITAVADLWAGEHVRAGRLVPVLPAWKLPPVPLWAVFAGRRLMPSRTKAFLDVMQARFAALQAHPPPQSLEAEAVSARGGRPVVDSAGAP